MKTLVAVIASALLVSPSYAFFTECTATQNMHGTNRPGGKIYMPRWSPIAKGSKIAVMDTYRDWAFVLQHVDDHEEYKWVPRASLMNCHGEDGTP